MATPCLKSFLLSLSIKSWPSTSPKLSTPRSLQKPKPFYLVNASIFFFEWVCIIYMWCALFRISFDISGSVGPEQHKISLVWPNSIPSLTLSDSHISSPTPLCYSITHSFSYFISSPTFLLTPISPALGDPCLLTSPQGTVKGSSTRDECAYRDKMA